MCYNLNIMWLSLMMRIFTNQCRTLLNEGNSILSKCCILYNSGGFTTKLTTTKLHVDCHNIFTTVSSWHPLLNSSSYSLHPVPISSSHLFFPSLLPISLSYDRLVSTDIIASASQYRNAMTHQVFRSIVKRMLLVRKKSHNARDETRR